MSRLLPLGVVALGLLAARPALACGGMFCDAVQPVDQSAERIVFSFDGSMLDTEVQISYQGEAHDFAWVVPVPAEPELYVSNDALFTALANATIPSYSLQSTATWYERSCAGLTEVDPPETKDVATEDTAYEFADAGGAGDDGSIDVVSTQTVGPYDTVVLKATDGDVLVQWLQDQGYALPDTLADVVEPYVNEDQYFVALKLSSDKSAGDLTPLGMRYAASAASIPLQLTSVAAVPDLPIEVFVLGNARAVPDNYLHVQLNEAAFDWYGGTANYRDVVAKAADEAGGQAFATDFVGPVSSLAALGLRAPGEAELAELATAADPIDWLDRVLGSITPNAQLTAFLPTVLPPPAGVAAVDFYACPDCYADQVDLPDWDPAAATTALDGAVVAPIRAQQARLDRANVLTRLFTTMDPEEMTADPIFVQNADLPQSVPLVHTATEHLTYVDGTVSERTLDAGGITYTLPDPAAPSTEAIDTPAAMIIEDLGATGTGTALFDGTEAAKAAAAAEDDGCGTKEAGGAAVPLLLLAGLARRRRG